MSLLIRGGHVVTPDGVAHRDVLCEQGRIEALLDADTQVPADEVLDATGLLVFPGFIDPHVHSRDPGQTEKEDFYHSTLGALVGGVTTIIEMPNALPPVDSVATFVSRREQHERNAWVDFALWGISLGDANLDQIGPLFDAGAAAVKLFWGYAQRVDTKQLVYNLADEPRERLILPPDNGAVLRVFREVAAAGGLFAAHCEDRAILEASEAELGHPVQTYDDLLAARPAVAEATAIATAAEFAAATGCRFHVVHVASEHGVAALRAARERGIRISAETCPQYLTLTAEDFPSVGGFMKVYPPIRLQSDQDALWQGLNEGVISSIGSDHAPHTLEEKSRGFATQPSGIVGCETFGPVLVDAMLRQKTSPERLAAVASTDTAKLFGLYPRKGVIEVGSDADFTIVDPNAAYTVQNDKLVAKHPISPWNGRRLTGAPIAASVLRGRVAMRNGQPVGTRQGRFVRAEHLTPRAAAR